MSARPDMTGWHQVFHMELDEPLALLNVWQRMHRFEKSRYQRRLQWLVREAAVPPPRPLFRSRIHVVRGNAPPRPDHDGLVGGLKPLLDVLACPRGRKKFGLGFIVDDSPLFVDSLTAESVITARGQGFTRIEIWAPLETKARVA